MNSTFGGLNTVIRGLAAQQAGLDTVGHNVSNANTTGYSRQTVNLVTTTPDTLYSNNGTMQKGSGVNVQSITRIRDFLIDKQMWEGISTLNAGKSKQDSLSKVETILNDTSDTGVQSVMNDFWDSWQTLATSASDDGTRMAVREQGVTLANTIQTAASQLTDMVSDINDTITTKVKSINQLTSEISSLNKQIFAVEAGGTDNANDLRDRRDALVDDLSGMVDVRVTEDSSGRYIIQSASTTLVSATDYTALKTVSSKDADYGYSLVNVADAQTGQVLNFTNGELSSMIDMRDNASTGIKSYLNNLSTMSQFLLTDFNAVHKTGYGTNNSTGNNFFGDASADYSDATATASYTKADWIDKLAVNQALFTTDGLAKIAAKTSANAIAVTQSNTGGGAASIASATGNYTNGDTATSVKVNLTVAAGVVTKVSYSTSTDGGKTWGTSTDIAGAGPYTMTINGITVNLNVAASASNQTGDQYNFTLSKGNVASGDNAVNLSKRLKNDTSALLGNKTLDGYYSTVVTSLGVQSQNAKRLTTNQQTLVNQTTNWRASVSGVSTDEELTNMIRFQKGYSSAARVLTAMDEMLDKLINGTGTVGR
ncbi:flagellar hook-associated protein FlgK [Propionispora hippei]|uniref:Flagellar hook-associated protein 1 n=1 Tax=Propionispora hippei DSM 15287 TaxID=1123003 RepID=A0A1M6FFY0_9FIRM|nr:flagellar hook-associated protein FlgK [Propionispora hippei]SHI96522.1 flagellar hook-associated protein 1 FlgK [Propionispora hippei DSM 15287]